MVGRETTFGKGRTELVEPKSPKGGGEQKVKQQSVRN